MDKYIGFDMDVKKTVARVVQNGHIKEVGGNFILYPINVARHFSASSGLFQAL